MLQSVVVCSRYYRLCWWRMCVTDHGVVGVTDYGCVDVGVTVYGGVHVGV